MQELCLCLGGQVTVSSNGHVGTTFTAEFRLLKTQRSASGSAVGNGGDRELGDKTNLSGQTVLLAEYLEAMGGTM